MGRDHPVEEVIARFAAKGLGADEAQIRKLVFGEITVQRGMLEPDWAVSTALEHELELLRRSLHQRLRFFVILAPHMNEGNESWDDLLSALSADELQTLTDLLDGRTVAELLERDRLRI